MLNGQKESQVYRWVWLDVEEIKTRMYKRRKKILDTFTIDNVEHIDYQLSYLPWEQIRDLMALFRCSIWQLSFSIKRYIEKTVF